MKERFLELWSRIGAKGDLEKEFSKLLTEYTEPQRFYHNMKHIENCLTDLDSARKLVQHFDSVEFAIWYHDVIYDTQAKDNEEKSAQLAYGVCLASQLPEDFAQKVNNLILVTKHDALPTENDSKLLIDIDLSILGKDQQEFDEYEKNIRKEYSWVPEDKFKEGRKALLQMFLGREPLYLTDFFREKYETQAKANLERSIEKLC